VGLTHFSEEANPELVRKQKRTFQIAVSVRIWSKMMSSIPQGPQSRGRAWSHKRISPLDQQGNGKLGSEK
jgi:hypothetical protein